MNIVGILMLYCSELIPFPMACPSWFKTLPLNVTWSQENLHAMYKGLMSAKLTSVSFLYQGNSIFHHSACLSHGFFGQGEVHAPIGRYPYMVSLFHPTVNTFTCGGILLSPQWVVTLAQCVAHSSFNNPPNPKVFVRDHTLNGVDIGEEVSHAFLVVLFFCRLLLTAS